MTIRKCKSVAATVCSAFAIALLSACAQPSAGGADLRVPQLANFCSGDTLPVDSAFFVDFDFKLVKTLEGCNGISPDVELAISVYTEDTDPQIEAEVNASSIADKKASPDELGNQYAFYRDNVFFYDDTYEPRDPAAAIKQGLAIYWTAESMMGPVLVAANLFDEKKRLTDTERWDLLEQTMEAIRGAN